MQTQGARPVDAGGCGRQPSRTQHGPGHPPGPTHTRISDSKPPDPREGTFLLFPLFVI